MANVVTKGNVTVYGAGGTVTFTGVASADMVSMAFADNFTLTEQENGDGNVCGAVASDQRYDMTLTFYPQPTAQTEAAWKAIALPSILDTVTITRTATSVLATAGNIPSVMVTSFHYVGGGRMDLTASGLMTMTLPLRRYPNVTPA